MNVIDKKYIGKQRIKEVLGDQAEMALSQLSEISPDFVEYIITHGYGEIYVRKGISDKHRELAAISCLIGQGNMGLALKTHLTAMLNVGWTKDEILEVLILLTGYVGFPSCVEAMMILKDILVEHKK